MRTFALPRRTSTCTDVPVLVVGAGPIAARKVAGLAAAGARRARRRPATSAPALDRTPVAELRQRPFEPADLDGVRLVVTATGDAGVDAAVAADATAAGIWVNAADQPADCSFILPAIARNGPLPSPSAPAAPARRSPAACATAPARCSPTTSSPSPPTSRPQRAAVRAAGGSTEDVDWSAAHRRRPARRSQPTPDGIAGYIRPPSVSSSDVWG